MTDSNLDCLTCGICCTSETDINLRVYVTDKESLQIPDKYKPKFEWQKNHMGFKPCGELFSCKALSGVIGKNVQCEIYLNRPKKCEQFAKGSERCLELRKINKGVLQYE